MYSAADVPLPETSAIEHAELPRAELEEVVVVAAHFARRFAEVRDVEAGDRRRRDRQQRLLNLARDAQLVVEPLLLALDVQQVLDAARSCG